LVGWSDQGASAPTPPGETTALSSDAPLLILYTSAETPLPTAREPDEKEDSMPHLKCVSCKLRYHAPGHLIDELCPRCGCPFEPVGELSELVGLRAITSSGGPTARGAPGGQDAFVARVGDALAAAEAVALPRPDTTC
jgi:hypothetical protein